MKIINQLLIVIAILILVILSGLIMPSSISDIIIQN